MMNGYGEGRDLCAECYEATYGDGGAGPFWNLLMSMYPPLADEQRPA